MLVLRLLIILRNMMLLGWLLPLLVGILLLLGAIRLCLQRVVAWRHPNSLLVNFLVVRRRLLRDVGVLRKIRITSFGVFFDNLLRRRLVDVRKPGFWMERLSHSMRQRKVCVVSLFLGFVVRRVRKWHRHVILRYSEPSLLAGLSRRLVG